MSFGPSKRSSIWLGACARRKGAWRFIQLSIACLWLACAHTTISVAANASPSPFPLVSTLPLDDYTVAWISDLSSEVEAAVALLDDVHQPLPSDDADPLVYTLGQIGEHMVVVARLKQLCATPNPAAMIATLITEKFPSIRTGLSVGIGNGVPTDKADLRVGDVVVGLAEGRSGAVVQYSWAGDDGPDPDEIEEIGRLNAPPTVLLDAVDKAQSQAHSNLNRQSEYLAALEEKLPDFSPQVIAKRDALLINTHRDRPDVWGGRNHRDMTERLEGRPSRDGHKPVRIHYGKIASAPRTIEDSRIRDDISKAMGGDVLCLEREAAGLVDDFPGLVIRGIYNYAEPYFYVGVWEPHAAATAASYAKAVLSFISPRKLADLAPMKERHFVPVPNAGDFLRARRILPTLQAHFNESGECRHVAIFGPGASGKSLVAIAYSYHVRELQSVSVFWVSASSFDRFTAGYREIALKLGIVEPDDQQTDFLPLVKERLSEKAGINPWLIIVDNAENLDDPVKEHVSVTRDIRLRDFLPCSALGMVLMITGTRTAAANLAKNDTMGLERMRLAEVYALFLALLPLPRISDQYMIEALRDDLRYLSRPVIQEAISTVHKILPQRVAAKSNIEIFLEFRHIEIGSLLGGLDADLGQNDDSESPVPIRWFMRFYRILRHEPLTGSYAFILACLAPTDIPLLDLFPETPTIKGERAIHLLQKILLREQRPGLFSIDRIARILLRNWMMAIGNWTSTIGLAMRRLLNTLFDGRKENHEACSLFLPHALSIISHAKVAEDPWGIDFMAQIAHCQMYLGDFGNAEQGWNTVIYWRRKKLGPTNPKTLEDMGNLAGAISSQGRDEEAEQILGRTLEIAQMVVAGDDHLIITILTRLGTIWIGQKRFAEAELVYRKVCPWLGINRGEQDKETLDCTWLLGKMLHEQGRHFEASQIYLQSLDFCPNLPVEPPFEVEWCPDMPRHMSAH